MHLENHYQNAYVTRDLDGALEIFRTRYGFDKFRRMEVSYELTTRAGRGTASVKLALGWIGDVQYEIIEPVSGLIEVYQEGLSDESPLRFHHACMRVPDWESFAPESIRRGFPSRWRAARPDICCGSTWTLGYPRPLPRILLDDARALDDDQGAVTRQTVWRSG